MYDSWMPELESGAGVLFDALHPLVQVRLSGGCLPIRPRFPVLAERQQERTQRVLGMDRRANAQRVRRIPIPGTAGWSAPCSLGITRRPDPRQSVRFAQVQ